MRFGEALERLQKGKRVTRAASPPNTWLALQRPDATSKIPARYLYSQDVLGMLAPLSAASGDLLAEDWLTVYATLAEALAARWRLICVPDLSKASLRDPCSGHLPGFAIACCPDDPCRRETAALCDPRCIQGTADGIAE